MRKNFGAKPFLYPQPVFIIATYNDDGTADAMNAAWGGISDSNQITMCISATHRTTKNVLARRAFTVSMGTADTVAACDYVGLVSGEKEPAKFDKAGFHAVKSEFVDAPVIEELPVTLECRLVKIGEDGHVIGQIVNVSAEESVLGEDGAIDAERFAPLAFDPARNVYRKIGGAAGKAFADGYALQ